MRIIVLAWRLKSAEHDCPVYISEIVLPPPAPDCAASKLCNASYRRYHHDDSEMAVAGAIIVAAAAPAAAATITPGYYQSQIYISAIKDPKNACADIGLVQGVSQPGVADVRGAGKPMYLTEMFTLKPPTASFAQEVVFVDYVFHDFPQTITDPVTYDGPARGTSPVTQGVSLRWTGGTLNTLTPNQFKLTASQITVTRDKTRLCTASIDAVFEATGLRKATGL